MLQLRANSRITRRRRRRRSAVDVGARHRPDLRRERPHAPEREADGERRGPIAGRRTQAPASASPAGPSTSPWRPTARRSRTSTPTRTCTLDLPAEGEAPAKRIRSATLTAGGGSAGTSERRLHRQRGLSRDARREAQRGGRQPRGTLEQADGRPRSLASARSSRRSSPGTCTSPTAPTSSPTHRTRSTTSTAIRWTSRRGTAPNRAPRPTSATGASASMRAPSASRSTTRKLNADTRVRSSMQPATQGGRRAGARGPRQRPATSGARVPSMLKQDEPVNVTSNRLEYDGAAGHAVYRGNARLWQGDTSVDRRHDRRGRQDRQPRRRAGTCGRPCCSRKPTRRRARRPPDPDRRHVRDVRLRRCEAPGDLHRPRRTSSATERDVTGDKIELFLRGREERARARGSVRHRSK